MAKLLLGLLLLLLQFHFLLLGLRQLSIGLVRLSNELFRNFAVLIGHLAERHFLDECRGARKGFDVLTGHFYFNDVHLGLTETVAEDEHDFDRTGYSEDVHLEDLFHRKVKVGPADRHLERLGHLPIVNQQDGVHLQLFNASLAALFRARQVFLRCWRVVVLKVKRLVDLPSLVSLLVYLQVDVGCREGSSLLQDFLPDFIHFVRHLIHFVLLLIKTSLHLFLSLDQEGDFLFGYSFLLGHLRFLIELVVDEPESVHVEGDHAERDPRLVVLELFFQLQSLLVFDGKVRLAVEELHVAQNDVQAEVALLERVQPI